MTHGQSSTELTVGVKQIDVITSDKVLGQTNNGSRQTDFTMMVCSLLCDISGQLSHLDLLDDTFLETPKEHLSLTWLQTVCARRNRSNVICHGEQYELLVDEVGDGDRGNIVIEVCSGLGGQFKLSLSRLTLNCLSHSFRSSAFFLLNAMSIRPRSSGLIVSKASRCLSRSLKYFLASADVLVPKP